MASYDKYASNPLFVFAGKIGDIMILCVLWVVCSLPIFTAGASAAALYHAVTKRFYYQSETPRKDFLHSFRQNLKQGTILSAIYVLYGAFVAFDIYVAFAGINGATLPDFFKQISITLLLPILFTIPYVFAYLSRFTAGTLLTLKNSFTFCAMHPLHSFLILSILLISGAAMVIFPPFALLLPVGSAYLCSRMLEKDFAKALAEDKCRKEAAAHTLSTDSEISQDHPEGDLKE